MKTLKEYRLTLDLRLTVHDLDDDLVLSGRGRVANYGAGSLSMDAGLDRSADVPVPPRTNKKVMNQ